MFSNSSVMGSLLVIFTLGGCVSNGLNNSADPSHMPFTVSVERPTMSADRRLPQLGGDNV